VHIVIEIVKLAEHVGGTAFEALPIPGAMVGIWVSERNVVDVCTSHVDLLDVVLTCHCGGQTRYFGSRGHFRKF
jgi:hypothetical protein